MNMNQQEHMYIMIPVTLSSVTELTQSAQTVMMYQLVIMM